MDRLNVNAARVIWARALFALVAHFVQASFAVSMANAHLTGIEEAINADVCLIV